MCGWGGEGHLGGGAGWGYGGAEYSVLSVPVVRRETVLTIYHYERADLCRPTTCPECGEEVFFIRHNGGSVWVDLPLGWPWPKHRHCNDSSSDGYEFFSSLGKHYGEAHVKPMLGRVVKRVYRSIDLVYLIETEDRNLLSVCTSRASTTIFNDLVIIRRTRDKIFLEDGRNDPVSVQDCKLAEKVLANYLESPEDTLYVGWQPTGSQSYATHTLKPKKIQCNNLKAKKVRCGHCGVQVREDRIKKHLKKVHGREI